MDNNTRRAIHGKLLARVMADAGGYDKKGISRFLEAAGGDAVMRVHDAARVEMTEEDGRKISFLRKETVICYPLGKYVMYESLFTLRPEEENPEVAAFRAEYLLVMLAPDGRLLDCSFFDTSKITGKNPAADDEYERQVLSAAAACQQNEEDMKALQNFVKLIRSRKKNS